MIVLVMAAHADDEVLGVGGTICKHVANRDEVSVCVATSGYEPEWSSASLQSRKEEQNEVDSLLKIAARYNLDLPTVRLNTIPHGELNKKITDVIDAVNPDIVYTHFESDINYDHTLICRATMVATRPPRHARVLCYETLSGTEWGNGAFRPNTWVDITGFIETKIQALQIYRSEIKQYPHPRSAEGVMILARKRGLDACTKYAEAFELKRSFWC